MWLEDQTMTVVIIECFILVAVILIVIFKGE
jgi:hypothetical protein